jgi:hypothetical protein
MKLVRTLVAELSPSGVGVSTDHFFGGRRVPGRFAVNSPIDGAHLADVAVGTRDDVLVNCFFTRDLAAPFYGSRDLLTVHRIPGTRTEDTDLFPEAHDGVQGPPRRLTRPPDCPSLNYVGEVAARSGSLCEMFHAGSPHCSEALKA